MCLAYVGETGKSGVTIPVWPSYMFKAGCSLSGYWMDEKRETEIIREVLAGNPGAFEELVRRYQGPVYSLMLRSLGNADDAADLAQEAFARAYTRLETFKFGKRFFPWLYSVSMNVLRDRVRAMGRDFHVYMETDALPAQAENAVDEREAVETRLDGEKAFEAVLRLAPKYREALILRFRYDFTMREIARTLGVSVSGAKMRVGRGLDMVREEFGRNE